MNNRSAQIRSDTYVPTLLKFWHGAVLIAEKRLVNNKSLVEMIVYYKRRYVLALLDKRVSNGHSN